MGGRGTKLIPGKNRFPRSSGRINEIDAAQFKNLPTGESMIKLKNYETLIAFNNAGVPVKAYKGGATSVSYPVDEALKWSGYTVTHNHPGQFGGTFSLADINGSTKYSYGSHRATAKEGVYIIKPRANARPVAFAEAYAKQARIWQTTNVQRTKSIINKLSARGASQAAITKAYRQSEVGRLHKWFKTNAASYGFDYIFAKGR